jgi:hypothetical protein
MAMENHSSTRWSLTSESACSARSSRDSKRGRACESREILHLNRSCSDPFEQARELPYTVADAKNTLPVRYQFFRLIFCSFKHIHDQHEGSQVRNQEAASARQEGKSCCQEGTACEKRVQEVGFWWQVWWLARRFWWRSKPGQVVWCVSCPDNQQHSKSHMVFSYELCVWGCMAAT